MGPLSRIRTAAGLLALGASIALASPGVNVVRAAPQDAPEPARAAAAQCGAARVAATPVDPQVDAFLDQLRRQHARSQFPAADADGEWVVLNSRGYNYGPAKGIELDQVRAEALGR